MANAGILIALALNAWQDIRKREIYLILTGGLVLYGIINIIWNRNNLLEYLASIGISVMFIGLSIVAPEGIGMGDAILLMALALNLPISKYLIVLCLTFLIAGGWAMVLLGILKKGKKTEFPFVPFLLLGYVGGLAIWI